MKSFFVIFLWLFVCSQKSHGASIIGSLPIVAQLLHELCPNLEVELLFRSAVSEHELSITPQQLKSLGKAKIYIGISKTFDGTWMESRNNLLGSTAKLHLLDLVDAGALKAPSVLGDEKSAEDPHFWLDPLLVQQTLPALVAALTKADPTAVKKCPGGLKHFAAKLSEQEAQLFPQKTLPLKGKTLISFHGGLSYIAPKLGASYAVLLPFQVHSITPKTYAKIKQSLKQIPQPTLICEDASHKGFMSSLAQEMGLPLIELQLTGTAGKAYGDYLEEVISRLRNGK